MLPRREAEWREKRKVVALNRLGQAAVEVRRAWVKEALLSRKTPPNGAALFIAQQLSEHPSLLGGPNEISTAQALLGLAERESVSAAVSALPPTADPRAAVITSTRACGPYCWTTRGISSFSRAR